MKHLVPLILAFAILVTGLFLVLKHSPLDSSSSQPSDSNSSPSDSPEEVLLAKSETSDSPSFAEAPRVPWPHETGDIPD